MTKLLVFSEPQSSHLQNRNNRFYLKGLFRGIHFKMYAEHLTCCRFVDFLHNFSAWFGHLFFCPAVLPGLCFLLLHLLAYRESMAARKEHME